MFRKIFLNQSSFAALILFLIIFVIDLGTLYNINILSPKLARDFLAVVGLILLLNGIIRWSYNISIYRKIKNILVSILFIFIINFFLSSNSRQPVSLKNLIISTAFSLISIFLLMIIFALIRELIFVQRRKSTNRNFNLLFVLLVCFSFFVKPTQLPSDLKFLPPVTSVMSTWQNIVTLMLTILTIYLIVINSFRIQWIKFVNKKEKIKTLFISLLIIALLVWWHAKGIIVAANYSLIVSSFFYVATIFITIYFSVSALVILLHLPTAGLYDRRVNELSSLHNL